MARVVLHIDELPGKFLDACNILRKIRMYRQRWQKDHDAMTLDRLKFWQGKADEFLSSLVIEEDQSENLKKVVK